MKLSRLAPVVLAGFTLTGCDLIQSLFPDPLITRRDCDTCAPIVFRDVADNSGTLASVLDVVAADLSNLPADVRPLLVYGTGIDMSGKVPLTEDTVFWTTTLISESELSYFNYQMEADGVVDFTLTTFETELEMQEAMAQDSDLTNLIAFESATMDDLFALPDPAQILATVAASADYNPSPFSYETALYNAGSPVIVANIYAESFNQDFVSAFFYDENGIRVYINDESEWTIVDFDSTDVVGSELTKEEWIETYYGKVDRDTFLAARKIYSLDIADPSTVTLLPPES